MYSRIIILALVGMSLLIAATVHAEMPASRAAKPTERIGQAGCVRDECHVNIKDYGVLHGPVAVNACDACHLLVDPVSHTFESARQGAEMCTYCHEYDISGMPVVHEPVKNGECLGCHDPHGGSVVETLRENSMPELCGRCHQSVTEGMTFLHNPVDVGACTSCHPPHASRLPKLLDVAGPDLCLYCHTDFDARLVKATFPHKAMEKGCQACHGVHGSNTPMSLIKPTTELCLDCHEQTKAELATADRAHTPVTQGRACLTCHTAHGGDLAKLMADVPAKICMDCHVDSVTAADGRVIPAASGMSDPSFFKHGPIKEGQCSGCHSPHGGQRGFLLAKGLSEAPHESFSPERFELCFNCHDMKLATSPGAGEATNFRDGNWNLHYVHVASDDRGRNCLLCHDSHAAGNDRIVRDTVRYGQWSMPIGFRQTPTGGSCQSGCHIAFTYDRDAPTMATTRPALQEIQSIARAEHVGLMEMDLTAEDPSGRFIAVPHREQPTVMVLLRADDAASRDVLRLIAPAVRDGAAQVVVIASGEAPDDLREALNANDLNWALLPDPTSAIAAQLDVRGWPMIVVVRTDGAEIARLSGAATSLAIRLRPYIALAGGDAPAPSADVVAATPLVVSDAVARRSDRYVHIAERLLAAGRVEEAEQTVQDALKRDPESAALRIMMARVQIGLKRGEEAMALLDALPTGALDPSDDAVLRARAHLIEGQDEQAMQLLLAALKRDPNAHDAHFLLGQIYEQQSDWENAAKQYRAAQATRREGR